MRRKEVEVVKKVVLSVLFALLAAFLAANVASACFCIFYQPALPRK